MPLFSAGLRRHPDHKGIVPAGGSGGTMLKRCESILEAIGRTPLVRLNCVAEELAAAVYAKLESVNPGGSVKDRVAVAMIEQAERDGLIKRGTTIIEATSGDMGAALAMAAAVKGYRCILVAPEQTSVEKLRLLRAYGADVVLTPASAASEGPEGCEGVTRRLLSETPDAWNPDQFGNQMNPQCHYATTAAEIWEQTEGRITAFVAGVGSGGTVSGVGQFLKEKDPAIRVVGVESEASVISGGERRPSAVEGIGEDRVPRTLNADIVDEWVRINDQEAFLTTRRLARFEGLLVGGSSGAALAAALRIGRGLGRDDMIVTLFADSGRNYLSRIYADEWLIKHGYLESPSQSQTVADVLRLRGPGPLISVTPDDTAETAIERLREHGISQIPVVANGVSVGSVRETAVTRLMHDRGNPREIPVREIMGRPLPDVEFGTDVSEVYRLLMSGQSGVLITRGGAIEGIVTRIDLVNFWEATRPQSSRTDADA